MDIVDCLFSVVVLYIWVYVLGISVCDDVVVHTGFVLSLCSILICVLIGWRRRRCLLEGCCGDWGLFIRKSSCWLGCWGTGAQNVWYGGCFLVSMECLEWWWCFVAVALLWWLHFEKCLMLFEVTMGYAEDIASTRWLHLCLWSLLCVCLFLISVFLISCWSCCDT